MFLLYRDKFPFSAPDPVRNASIYDLKCMSPGEILHKQGERVSIVMDHLSKMPKKSSGYFRQETWFEIWYLHFTSDPESINNMVETTGKSE